MTEYVTDTHTLLWYLLASPLLSAKAKSVFDEAELGLVYVHIPSIVFAELYFLTPAIQPSIGKRQLKFISKRIDVIFILL